MEIFSVQTDHIEISPPGKSLTETLTLNRPQLEQNWGTELGEAVLVYTKWEVQLQAYFCEGQLFYFVLHSEHNQKFQNLEPVGWNLLGTDGAKQYTQFTCVP